jgi:hypothetical protein
MTSACGVLCSDCAAYHGREKGRAYQRRAAAAWKRIWGRPEKPEQMACGGCLGPDAGLFHTSVRCRARRCCMAKGLGSCAECSVEACPDLERAQAVWDGVPAVAATLAPRDCALYAAPYCGHRERLAGLRARLRDRA